MVLYEIYTCIVKIEGDEYLCPCTVAEILQKVALKH